jgi:DNA (cytosine-5)-methyltransferase 1
MKYLSLFSGIEAATVAWEDFGWECVGVSEIDAFPCELLKQRYPHIPNLGDITQITQETLDELGTIDIVVGGSPCQAFSTAGNRAGLNDPRGRLMYDYIRVVDTVRPKWFVWENVPGVLSQDGGTAFGTLLREMACIGYSLCWRVLDAQHFGVPQRRRRVYLVGHLGTDRECASKVLFDSQSRSRNLKKSREAEQEATATTEGSSTINSKCWTQNSRFEVRYINLDGKTAGSLCANAGQRQQNYLHQTLAKDGTTKGVVVNGRQDPITSRVAQALTTCTSGNDNIFCDLYNGSISDTACAMTTATGTSTGTGLKLITNHIVRRLTPVECERLQGFPDNHTRIEWRDKPAEECPDGHRYKALGNSMAVPVMRWIGHNIQQYDERFYLPW